MATKFAKNIESRLTKEVSIYPLVTFRVIFGALMLFSISRFWYNGWIEDFYLSPTHFFPYFGLDWIQPYGENFMYGLFIIMVISALGILTGAFYRFSAMAFFICFTYVELIDKTTYLNHYYFISLIAFLLIFVPAHRAISLDAYWFPRIKTLRIKKYSILILQLQIAVVYFFAGVAKLNYDWLIEAQPMSIWLSSKANFPLIGNLLTSELAAYVFSWAGLLFDLFIAFILFSNRWRVLGYSAVVCFHIFTWLLFPIGVFPWVMIGLTLIFFLENWHEKIWVRMSRSIAMPSKPLFNPTAIHVRTHSLAQKSLLALMTLYFIFQITVPLRFLALPGDLYWAESGYRFSWRVMLTEKTGFVEFSVKDIATQKERIIQTQDYFSRFQQRQISTQPDMIRQAAQIIADDFQEKGKEVQVFANSYASLNGKKHKALIDPDVDLAAIKSPNELNWILQYED